MHKIYPSLIAALVLSSASGAAQAKDVTVMISGGFKAALEKLAPQYETQSGNHIILVSGPSMGKSAQAIPNRLARGEKTDVVIMVGDALENLEKERWLQPGSRVELADSPIGVVVKQGQPKPDISSRDALRATLLQAGSVAYSDSASGRYVSSRLFDTLGIAAQMKDKAHKVERVPVAGEVAGGKYALGFQQVSELLPVPGVTFIGELPDSVQYITRFAGAVTAHAEHRQEGKALLDFLSSPTAQQTIAATGLKSVPAVQTVQLRDAVQ
ncbi:substrate-binding domain-containing protein [Serratia rhizosphaerae]|uniref:substrate-binding domain-containing protein n=1 Tax=Serratia rhizosphaerae TaxID=2597702 RepID=UPI002DBA600A|nr:substrate-binding domain-containing protein [Serratia rhizosphaerae]MEB6334439.1 substrate-binding domain-containing protein [Serratia rhizosphaerae]